MPPTVTQMIDIDNAIRILAVAFATGLAGIIGTFVLAAKWYIPRRMKQQTQERQTQIDDLKNELASKRAAEAVDIERERILPQLVEGMQRLMESQIQTAQANNAAIMARIEQDARNAAVIDANTRQLTTHSSVLAEGSEKLEIVQIKLDKLYDRFTKVFPRDTNISELFNELKGVLEETKQACIDTKRKGDSKPIPIIPLPTPAIPLDGENDTPDALKPTG